MHNRFKTIFGIRALRHASSADSVDWASDMLAEGFDSRSLRMLASLDKSAFASTAEAEACFLRSVRELNVDIPTSEEAIRGYACEIAWRITNGTLAARDGVGMLYQTCRAADYSPEFVVWYQLSDALDSLLKGVQPYSYESVTLENFEEVAKREATDFIATVCGHANSLSTPSLDERNN